MNKDPNLSQQGRLCDVPQDEETAARAVQTVMRYYFIGVIAAILAACWGFIPELLRALS